MGMTVKELIEKLKKANENAIVIISGDMDYNACDIEITEDRVKLY